MSGRHTYDLDGVGRVVFGDNEHIATGGEGSVFYAGSDKTRVVKVYLDPPKMVQRGTFNRLKSLTTLKSVPGVVGPQGLAYLGGEPVGFWMPHASGEGLAAVSTNDWRTQNRFGDKEAHLLVAGMFNIIQAAHDRNFTVVDPNQNNWLAELAKAGVKANCLDVDSWIPTNNVPSHIAVNLAVRDYHSEKSGGIYVPTHLADWFSVGTVAFEVLVGIHPYRGFISGHPRNKYEPRMRANASVFHKDCGLPQSVRDFSSINGPLRDWFYSVFEEGKRCKPPNPLDTGVAKTNIGNVLHVQVTATSSLRIEELLKCIGDPAIRVFHCGVVVTASGKLIDLASKRQIGVVKDPAKCEVTKVDNVFLVGDWEQSQIIPTFSYINQSGQQGLSLQLAGSKLVRFENRMFLVTDQGLTELNLMVFGPKAVLALGQKWGLLVNSTRWFEGTGVMDMMGKKNLVCPHGTDKCRIVRVSELDGVKTVAAKAGERFASVVTLNGQGEYHRLDITFDETYSTYKVENVEVDSPELNIAIYQKADSGSSPAYTRVARIDKDGEINISAPTKSSRTPVCVQDKKISTRMVLANSGSTVVYISNGAIGTIG